MALAGLVVVAAGAAALAVGAGSGPLTSAADRDDEVALAPDDRDVDGSVDDPAAGRELTATEVPEGGCEPVGCERWRTEVGSGDTLVVDDRIVHHADTRLSVLDATDGEVLAEVDTQAPADARRLQIAGTGDGQGPAVILPGPTGFEVRELADGALRWSADTEQGPRTPVVRDDLVLTTDASPTGQRIRVFAVADGRELLTVDDALVVAGGEVIIEQVADDEVRLLEPATGEARLTVEPEAFRGVGAGRIGLVQDGELVVRTWPELEELGRFPDDPAAPARFIGGLVVAAQPADDADPAEASPDDVSPMGAFIHAPRAVIDPVTGEVVAELDAGLPIVAAPDGAGVLVAEEEGSRVVVSQRDAGWSLTWRTALSFERSSATSLQIIGAPDGGFDLATMRDNAIEQSLPFRARGGVPGFPPSLGSAQDRTVAATLLELSMVRSPDQTELRGEAGAVRFDEPVDLIHAADPLLVSVDGDLVAIDEALIR